MRVRRVGVLDREIRRFQEDPSSPRNAAFVIIAVTVSAVIVGSLVIWLFDRRDFPDYGTALWFALQTVTTVGYGDVTPESTVGRVVGGIVMIVAIAFLTVVTALITSTFVEALQARRRQDAEVAQRDATASLHARLDEVITRLEAIERAMPTPAAAVSVPAQAPAEPGPSLAPPTTTGDDER
jgi:voltage-gated potassium channel